MGNMYERDTKPIEHLQQSAPNSLPKFTLAQAPLLADHAESDGDRYFFGDNSGVIRFSSTGQASVANDPIQ